jgi:hypothetical protein
MKSRSRAASNRRQALKHLPYETLEALPIMMKMKAAGQRATLN